ncbi:aspartic proteinase nepenthesin-2-like [Silene latifolia]|uniref:aspartic proteinase nepenthesin-2-like n=1 Tax=Silene latifolia TaxID=37657 RepID=UPI003D784A45
MDVIGVQVNGVDIKVDPSVFALSPDAQTGFVIDSGYDITSLSNVAFNALKDSIQKILGTPVMYSGYEICYLYSTFGSHWPYKQKPKIGIKFRDGVFELDESNAWRRMSNTNLDCLLMLRTPAPGEKLSFLGNEQLFDVNVGHDPINNLLYLQPMKCPTSF